MLLGYSFFKVVYGILHGNYYNDELIMSHIFYLLLSLALLTGCGGPRYGDFFLYRDDGTVKPKVALIPIASWERTDGTREAALKNAIVSQLCENGELFLYTDEEIDAVLNRSQNCQDFSSLSACFRPADFVVETLIVQDSCVPSRSLAIPGIRDNPLEHIVRVRLQIMDIRSNCPKVVLLETVEQRETVIVRENYRAAKSCLYDTLSTKITERIENTITWRQFCP